MGGTTKGVAVSKSWIPPKLLLAVTTLMLVGGVTGALSYDLQPWERHLQNVKSKTSPDDQAQAVEGLLQRLLPERAHEFAVRVDPSIGPEGRDTFVVSSPGVNGSVDVSGTSGVAAAWGILHYLKYYCNAHVSWEADQLDLPETLPPAEVNITSNDRFRYYQNVCTVSYSMAWWGWQRWEREIDWMALNGINLPLAFTGQEAIWHRIYTKMGMTQEELDEHFVGPAFLAWGRMGNIRGWGGPLSTSWHNQTLALQKQIVARMRQFGMIPILPAFAGHVPAALTRIYPTANVTRLGPWAHFTDPYTRTYLLDPNDPLFQAIGSTFIQEMTSEFGSDHFYNCDTFNEMTPASKDTEYLRSIGAAVYGAMTKADPDAVWVMQGWLFFNDASFWHKTQAQALLTSVPIGRMLVLDLASEVAPQYNRLESYFGQPFIFCMLHDYGGVDGLYGSVDTLLKNMVTARSFPNVTLVGTGLTPEGINQNYVMYDFMNELGWRSTSPNVSSWAVDYARRRYGSDDPRLGQAWQLLMRSVYNDATHTFNHGQYVLVTRPDLGIKPDKIWYSLMDVIRAWDLLVEVAKSETYKDTITEHGAEGKQNVSRLNTEAQDVIGDSDDVNRDTSAPPEQPNVNIENQQIYTNEIRQNSSRNKMGDNRHRSTQEHHQNRIRRSLLPAIVADREEHSDKFPTRKQKGINILDSLRKRLEVSMGEGNEAKEIRRDWRLLGVKLAAVGENNTKSEYSELQENESVMNDVVEEGSTTSLRENSHEAGKSTKTKEYIIEGEMFEGTKEEGDEKTREGMEMQGSSTKVSGSTTVTNQSTFQHDLVDVTRQILQIVGGQMVLTLVQNYNNQVLLALEESHTLLQELLVDLDLLLGSSPDFLLGRWVDASASWATNEKERNQYVFNALNQITLWGPTGEIHDYAIKQWSGLIKNYIRPRWELFSQTLLTSLEQGEPFDGDRFRFDLFTLVEDPFTKNTNVSYPSQPQGDSVQIAIDLYTKYRPIFDPRLVQVFMKRYQSSLRMYAKKMKMKKMRRKGVAKPELTKWPENMVMK